MDLNLSHFGLLIFGFILALPREEPRDRGDYFCYGIVLLIFAAMALLWQRTNYWPGFFTNFAILALMHYVAMFALGILFGRIVRRWVTVV